jgi:redox-sensitive bicupin YhaK (pirin superfamily)
VQWVQVAHGAVHLNGQHLTAGDGAAINDETALTLRAETPAELLLFDMAP